MMSYETESLSPHFVSWNVTDVKPSLITVKLEFTEPLKISQGYKPDTLLISMNFCNITDFGNIKDTNGKPLPKNIFKIVAIPP